MQENQENKIELKDKLQNFYSLNKVKIYFLLIALLSVIVFVILFNNYEKKKNIKIGQQFIQSGIHLSSDRKDLAKEIYEQIILSKNNFYSILALNTILEKNLISEKNKILEYFNILENTVSSKEEKDLIILKKALYLIKNSEVKAGENLMKNLINQGSSLKPIIKEFLEQ